MVRNVGAFVPPHDGSAGYHGTAAAIEFAVLKLNVDAHRRLRPQPLRRHPRAVRRGAHRRRPTSPPGWNSAAKPRCRCRCTPEALRRTEQRSVVLQLERLMGYPMVRERVEAGRLALHGWHYVIEDGEVHVFDVRSGRFVPASSADAQRHRPVRRGAGRRRQPHLQRDRRSLRAERTCRRSSRRAADRAQHGRTARPVSAPSPSTVHGLRPRPARRAAANAAAPFHRRPGVAGPRTVAALCRGGRVPARRDRAAEAAGAGARPVEPVPAGAARRRARHAARRTSTTRRWPRSWAACPGPARSSTATRPTPATSSCCTASPRPAQAERWLQPLLRRRDALVLRDERARRRVERPDQHRDHASAATATSTCSTAASGSSPAPRTRTAGSRVVMGRSRRRARHAGARTPHAAAGADGHAGPDRSCATCR